MLKAWKWLTDPEHKGRKRGVAAALFIAAEVARAGEAIVQKACEKALLVGQVCSIHVGAYAGWADTAYQIVDQLMVPGAELTGVIVGVWGLINAKKKATV